MHMTSSKMSEELSCFFREKKIRKKYLKIILHFLFREFLVARIVILTNFQG